jgi:hypothetical protein
MADEDFEQEAEEQGVEERDDWPGAERKQAAFLTALVTFRGHHTRAARAAKVGRASHYRWLEDETYKALYARAMAMVTTALEDEALRRAHDGIRKGIYYQGERVGNELVYSDGLMMFMLRAANPKKYRENHDHSGDVNHHLKFDGSLMELLSLYRRMSSSSDSV